LRSVILEGKELFGWRGGGRAGDAEQRVKSRQVEGDDHYRFGGHPQPGRSVAACMDTFAAGTGSPVPWQKACADNIKELCGTIETKEHPNKDHFSLPNHCAPDARQRLNT